VNPLTPDELRELREMPVKMHWEERLLATLDASNEKYAKLLGALLEVLDATWRSKHPTERVECKHCGYSGLYGMLDCECYDEARMYCRPDAPGPGCPNGGLTCPVCDDGEGNDGWDAIKEIRKFLTENP
jgi:hypothetical protein